jgi:hypothetical protein
MSERTQPGVTARKRPVAVQEALLSAAMIYPTLRPVRGACVPRPSPEGVLATATSAGENYDTCVTASARRVPPVN